MKLIKVKTPVAKSKKKDEVDEQQVKQFAKKAYQQSSTNPNEGNGFCGYEIYPSRWNNKNFVEIMVDLPSYSMEGNADRDSLSKAIKITEARLKTLKDAQAKLKKLQDEAKNLGFKLG